ncbi:MFS transporter [Bifidobacterium callimiconis]|nr:MFS transporter [Bifidobacterium callimiconis]
MAFIGILTETLMNVLFPELMEEFHISTTTVQWLTTSYLLVVALVTPLSSYFKRKIAMKTIFIIAMILCLAGSLFAACTLNFPMLLSARVLQGAGTGMALPLMFNIILEQSPKSKIGMLMGIGNLVCATAPALGPTVGGLVGTFMPWRWIFVITFALLVIFMVFGLISIRQVTPTVETHLNPLHVLCIVIAFVSFIFAVERGGLAITSLSAHAEGAARALILPVCLLIVCIVTLALFAWMSRRSFLSAGSIGGVAQWPVPLASSGLRTVAGDHDRVRLHDSQFLPAGVRCCPADRRCSGVAGSVGGCSRGSGRRFIVGQVWCRSSDYRRHERGGARCGTDGGAGRPGFQCDRDRHMLFHLHAWILHVLRQHDDQRHGIHCAAVQVRRQCGVQYVPTACRRGGYHGDVRVPGHGTGRYEERHRGIREGDDIRYALGIRGVADRRSACPVVESACADARTSDYGALAM